MPITSSAKKALRRDKRKTTVNRVIRTRIKSALTQANQNKDLSSVNQAYSVLDRAVKRNIIHKNKAARIKSKLRKNVDNQVKKTVTSPSTKIKASKKATSKTKKKTK